MKDTTIDLHHSALLLTALFVLVFSLSAVAHSQVTMYTDSNQYFAALPPVGWVKEEYPNETIRSKVLFRHPTLNILIRVIAEPAVRKDYTFDELLAQHKVRQGQMRERFPGGKYEMKTGTLAELKAIVHRNSYSTGEEHEMVSSVHDGIIYSIGMTAGSIGAFNKGYKPFHAFLTSFTPLTKGKRFSEDEIKVSLVAKYRRLAELFEELGNIPEAIDFISQALALEPNNLELIAIMKRLEAKK